MRVKWTLSILAVTLLAGAATAAGAAAATGARDVSKRAGVYETTHTWGAAPHDFSGDGLEDVLIGTHYEGPARLYRNAGGGRFLRVPEALFPTLKRDRHDCDWGDVNNDRLDDVYCSVGGGRGYVRNPNELWMQQPDGSFIDRAGVYRVRDLDGRGRDVAFLDANRDGFVDLFVGNGFPRFDGRVSKNKLFINVGGERFRNAPEYGLNRKRTSGQTVEAIDYNGDDWTDLLVCGDSRLHLYKNLPERDRFRDVTLRARADMRCEASQLADMNGDRRPDLVTVQKRRLVVKRQKRGRFGRPVYRRRLSGGGDVAVGQVNGDRRPDVYVLQRGPIDRDRPDLMLLNRRGGRHFSGMRIPQTRQGKGDAVEPIDHDANGRTDFVVLNGDHKARGPVRLVAFFPRSR